MESLDSECPKSLKETWQLVRTSPFLLAITLFPTTLAVVSASAACWSAYSAHRSALHREARATELDSTNEWQRYHWLITRLQEIQQYATGDNIVGTTPCQNGDCLGKLSFAQEYIPQYEMIAEEAFWLRDRVRGKASALTFAELANAAYILGRLSLAEQLCEESLQLRHDYTMAYRIEILRARCAFMRGELNDGQRHIDSSIAILESVPGITYIELALKSARSALTCSEMHLALGRPKQATACMEAVHNILNKMPSTSAVEELRLQLKSLIVVAYKERNHPTPAEFRPYVASVEKDWLDQQAVLADDGSTSSVVEDGRKEKSVVIQAQAIEAD